MVTDIYFRAAQKRHDSIRQLTPREGDAMALLALALAACAAPIHTGGRDDGVLSSADDLERGLHFTCKGRIKETMTVAPRPRASAATRVGAWARARERMAVGAGTPRARLAPRRETTARGARDARGTTVNMPSRRSRARGRRRGRRPARCDDEDGRARETARRLANGMRFCLYALR